MLQHCACASLSFSEKFDLIEVGSSRKSVADALGSPDKRSHHTLPDGPYYGPSEGLAALSHLKSGCIGEMVWITMSGLPKNLGARLAIGVWYKLPGTLTGQYLSLLIIEKNFTYIVLNSSINS